jgi:uncharacterized protein YxeA
MQRIHVITLLICVFAVTGGIIAYASSSTDNTSPSTQQYSSDQQSSNQPSDAQLAANSNYWTDQDANNQNTQDQISDDYANSFQYGPTEDQIQYEAGQASGADGNPEPDDSSPSFDQGYNSELPDS